MIRLTFPPYRSAHKCPNVLVPVATARLPGQETPLPRRGREGLGDATAQLERLGLHLARGRVRNSWEQAHGPHTSHGRYHARRNSSVRYGTWPARTCLTLGLVMPGRTALNPTSDHLGCFADGLWSKWRPIESPCDPGQVD